MQCSLLAEKRGWVEHAMASVQETQPKCCWEATAIATRSRLHFPGVHFLTKTKRPFPILLLQDFCCLSDPLP